MQCSVHQSTCCRFEDVHATLLRWCALPLEYREELQLIPIAGDVFSCTDVNEALFIYKRMYRDSPRILEAKKQKARKIMSQNRVHAVARYEADIRSMYPLEAEAMLEKFHEMQRQKQARRQKRVGEDKQSPSPMETHPIRQDQHIESQDNVNQHVSRPLAEGVSNITTPVIIEEPREAIQSQTDDFISAATGMQRAHMLDLQTRANTRAEERSAFRSYVRQRDDPESPVEEEYMSLANRSLGIDNLDGNCEYLRVARRCVLPVYVLPTSAVLLGLVETPAQDETGMMTLVQACDVRREVEDFITHVVPAPLVPPSRPNPIPNCELRNGDRPITRSKMKVPSVPPVSSGVLYVSPHSREVPQTNSPEIVDQTQRVSSTMPIVRDPRMIRGTPQGPVLSVFPAKKVPPNQSTSLDRDRRDPPPKTYIKPKYTKQASSLPYLYSSDNAPPRPIEPELKRESSRSRVAQSLPPVKQMHTCNSMRPSTTIKRRREEDVRKSRVLEDTQYVPTLEEQMNQGISPD